MLSPILLLVACVPAPQDGPLGAEVRAGVLAALADGRGAWGYELELREYDVEYGCDLGRALLAHLERAEPAEDGAALDAIDLLEESADVGVGRSPVTEVSILHARVLEAGARRLLERRSPMGEVLDVVVEDGERRARYEPARGVVVLGPRLEGGGLEGGAADEAPVPTQGPWLRALEGTRWRPAPGGHGWLAALDRDGRRLDLTFDLAAGEAGGPPCRAVATYHGVRDLTREALLLGWEREGERWFLAESVRITAGDEALRVRHARRSKPRRALDEDDVVLEVPPPEAVELASTAAWRSFRRREAVPPEWRDLVRVRD